MLHRRIIAKKKPFSWVFALRGTYFAKGPFNQFLGKYHVNAYAKKRFATPKATARRITPAGGL
jgi:hypothetical protein